MKAVIALQKKLLNECSKVSNILLHAHLIACKLNLEDFKTWCSLEINGYHSLQDSEVPSYRWIRGTLHLEDPLTGDISALPSPIEFSYKVIRDSVIKLEEYNFDERGGVNLFLSPDIEDYFKENLENYSQCIGYLRVSKSDCINALYNIRVKILEFTEELEKKGILGEDWEFTEQEKQMTQNINYHIGNVGNMANHNDNSTINQTSTNTVQVIKGDFNSLASKLKDYGVEETDIQDLKNVIDVTPTPTSSDELGEDVTNWLGKMSLKALKGSLKVGKDVAMGVLVDAITTYYCG